MSRETFQIEQQTGIAIARELGLEQSENDGVAGKLLRRGHAVLKRRRDEFAKIDGSEQACSDAAGEGRAEASQHRQAGPERVAGRRVGIMRQRVENRSAWR